MKGRRKSANRGRSFTELRTLRKISAATASLRRCTLRWSARTAEFATDIKKRPPIKSGPWMYQRASSRIITHMEKYAAHPVVAMLHADGGWPRIAHKTNNMAIVAAATNSGVSTHSLIRRYPNCQIATPIITAVESAAIQFQRIPDSLNRERRDCLARPAD